MKVKSVELTDFKRFTHLIVEEIPKTAKLVVLVGPNGSGKTSFMEAMNYYYQYSGYQTLGDNAYLSKLGNQNTDINRIELAERMINIEFHDVNFPKKVGKSDIKGHFYFRSAYRNEPDFKIDSMTKQGDPTDGVRLKTLIQNDSTVSSNYQRLVSNSISKLYDQSNAKKNAEDLTNELIGKIRSALEHIFTDLKFSSLGDPLVDGNFYFQKGTSKRFPYKNLSAGEKATFDLVLDLVVQSRYFPDAVYCIDEPEIHMHTKLQNKVLRTLLTLIPGESQLWLSTHSIGMLQEAEDIEKEQPGSVVFLDFGGRDFDTDQVIRPTKISRAVLEKFYELAFGDFAKLLLPKILVICEGSSSSRNRRDFDKAIYSCIFAQSHPEAFFISGGNCEDIKNTEVVNGGILGVLLKNTEVIKLIDRDDLNSTEVGELKEQGITVLEERNIESYLFDDSVIKKLCESHQKSNKLNDCLEAKRTALDASVVRGNAPDDYKSARGEIYTALKKILGLTKCGNNADTFIRDSLAPLITPDMEVYQRLENEIFSNCVNI